MYNVTSLDKWAGWAERDSIALCHQPSHGSASPVSMCSRQTGNVHLHLFIKSVSDTEKEVKIKDRKTLGYILKSRSEAYYKD